MSYRITGEVRPEYDTPKRHFKLSELIYGEVPKTIPSDSLHRLSAVDPCNQQRPCSADRTAVFCCTFGNEEALF